MKKNIRIIIYLLILLGAFITKIHALDISNFTSPWNEKYNIEEKENGNYTTKIIKTNNGYIRIGKTNNNEAYISKIDNNGQNIWQNKLKNITIHDVIMVDNYLYLALSDNYSLSSILVLKEENGDVIDISDISPVSYMVNYQTIIKLYYYQDKIYLILSYLNIPSEVIEYDINGNSYNPISIGDIPIKEIMKDDYNLVNFSLNNYSQNIKNYNWPTYYYWKKGIKIGDYYYMITASPYIDSTYYNNQGLLLKVDKDGNYISHLVLEDIYEITDIATSNNEIYISGNSLKNNKNIGYIYNIDENLNIKNSTNTEELYNDPNPTFTKATALFTSNDLLLVAGIGENKTSGDGYIWGIDYPYSIKTTQSGKGQVIVKKSAYGGKEVTFEIVPEEGYVLGVVKVTDANGNILTFTSNTFTMPSSDVTIEVIFLPENPDTKDITIIIFSIFIISGVIFIICNKHLKKV